MKVFPIRTNLSVAVTGATNAIPIVVTTASAHELVTAETVDINGVRGNTNTNGNALVVTVASSTTFSLAGIKGNGAFVGTEGTVKSNIALATARTYAAVTAAAGSVHTLEQTVNQSARFGFYVDATDDPTGVNDEVDVIVYGRSAPDSDWFQISQLDETVAGWAQVGSGRWLNKALDLPVQPQLRMDVVVSAASTNVVRGWIVL